MCLCAYICVCYLEHLDRVRFMRVCGRVPKKEITARAIPRGAHQPCLQSCLGNRAEGNARGVEQGVSKIGGRRTFG